MKFLDSLDIENVHVKFCKFLLGVNKRAVNVAVKGDLERFPIGISCMLQAFKYWYHIQSSNSILLREALAVFQDLHKERIVTWFSFFSSLCKLINVKPSDITFCFTKGEIMRLLYSILVRSYKNVQQNGYLLFTKAKVWVTISGM